MSRAAFDALVASQGSQAVYHRESGGTPCPCRTPEGFRDLKWHRDNPGEPVCNEAGFLDAVVTDAVVMAFIQPVQAGAVRRMTTEYLAQMFGQVETDDHLGFFTLESGGVTFDFYDWPQDGSNFIGYDGRRFNVAGANKFHFQGTPHHWEIGLRLIKTERPS